MGEGHDRTGTSAAEGGTLGVHRREAAHGNSQVALDGMQHVMNPSDGVGRRVDWHDIVRLQRAATERSEETKVDSPEREAG